MRLLRLGEGVLVEVIVMVVVGRYAGTGVSGIMRPLEIVALL